MHLRHLVQEPRRGGHVAQKELVHYAQVVMYLARGVGHVSNFRRYLFQKRVRGEELRGMAGVWRRVRGQAPFA